MEANRQCGHCGRRLWGEQPTCAACRLAMKMIAREDVDVADEIAEEFGDDAQRHAS